MDETTVLAVLTEIRDELRLLRMNIYARDELGLLEGRKEWIARAAGRDLHDGAQLLAAARTAEVDYAKIEREITAIC